MSSADNKAVFLSYASQDAETAKRIADALRSSGVEVWFDAEGGLEHGDEWDAKIRRQIKECVLFIAVISANTQAREEGYFRIEWDLAAERARGIASGVAFILPIVIDDTREPDALVPDRFRKVQWTRLPGGAVPPDVLQRFLKLWSHRTGALKHSMEAGRPRPAEEEQRGGGTPPPNKFRLGWITAAVVAVLIAVALWQPWKKNPPARAAAGPAASSPGKLSEARQLDAQARALIDDDLMAVRENYRLADEFTRRAVALDATDGEAWATAARVSALILQLKYEMTPERKELAKIQVERANRLAPASIETGLAQAVYLAVNGDVPQAERQLRQLIQRAPADKRLWWHLGTILHQAERFDDALGLFRQTGGLLDGDPRGETLRASLLIRLGRYREAEAVLGQVLQQSPTKVAYSWNLVLLGFYRCDLPAASRFLEQIPPGLMHEDAMINLAAEIWLRLGDGDKALKALQKSPRDFLEEGFEIRPKGYVAGHALQLAGRPTAALAEWRQALVVMEKRLAANPNQPLLLYWHALLQALTGQKAAAIETRKLYRELEAKPDAWFDAILLVALGDNEQAIRGLLEGWPKANFNLRSDIRGDLMYAPWLAAIRQDPRIQSLIAEHTAAIERDRSGPVAAGPKADDKSVAVLAFANLSDDKANEYFSDGISEELLNVLAKVPGLKVTARTSSFHFKGKDTPIPEIAKQLGVAYVIEGSVRKAGDKVRITAQLIKAADGFHVWSDTFTRDIKDVFAVQDEIAGLIAKNLQLTLRTKTRARSVNPEAYELLLKGRALFNRGMPAEYPQGIQFLKDSLAIDPESAAAWGRLSMGYMLAFAQNVPDWLPRDEILRLARQAADRAIELDSEQSPGHYAKCLIAYLADWDWARADASMQRVLALTPGDAESQGLAASLALMAGQISRARDAARRAVALDPLNFLPAYQLMKAHWQSGDYEELEKESKRVIAIHPGSPYGHTFLSYSLVLRGRAAEAGQAAEQVTSASYRLNSLALAHYAQGKTVEADAELAQLKKQFGATSAYQVAENYAFRKDRDQAFEWLEAAYRERDSGLTLITHDPFFENLRGDTRWSAFMRKMNLPDGVTK